MGVRWESRAGKGAGAGAEAVSAAFWTFVCISFAPSKTKL